MGGGVHVLILWVLGFKRSWRRSHATVWSVVRTHWRRLGWLGPCGHAHDRVRVDKRLSKTLAALPLYSPLAIKRQWRRPCGSPSRCQGPFWRLGECQRECAGSCRIDKCWSSLHQCLDRWVWACASRVQRLPKSVPIGSSRIGAHQGLSMPLARGGSHWARVPQWW